MSDGTATQQPTPDTTPETLGEEAKNKKQFEELKARGASEQNLPEGGVPEQRPIASQAVTERDRHSDVFKRLQEAGDDRAGAPAMDKSAYDRAASDAHKRKAAREERQETRLYPGTRAWIDNEGEPDHGRAVAVNGVREYESVEEERLAAAGTPESRFAKVKSYECVSRDGRSEYLTVSAEHLRVDRSGGADWGKSPLNSP